MRSIRHLLYLLLAALLVIGIFILLTTDRKIFDRQISKSLDNDILVNPQNYYYHDARKTLEPDFNGKVAFVDVFDSWTEFIPGLHIYAAFASDRNNQSGDIFIRIISVGKKLDIDKSKVKCLLQRNQIFWEEPLTDIVLNYQPSFSYFTFICTYKQSLLPQRISLNYSLHNTTSSWMQIHYKREENVPKHQITVCVPPVFQKFRNIELLAEFLAYYETVGVSSFVFYHCDMGNNIKEFLDMASRSGLNITIVPWTLQPGVLISMRNALQLASIQHCIFQNRGISNYVLPLHIDEFLIPRQHFSLTELMNELSTRSKRNVGSYVFRQSNFCSLNATSIKREDVQLVSTRDILREDKVWSAKLRSNFMAVPDSVVEGGLYSIRKHAKSWVSANVPWQLALIHHYIPCPDGVNIAKLVEDRTAESFRIEILLSKAMAAFRKFKKLVK